MSRRGPYTPRGLSPAEWIRHNVTLDALTGCWTWGRRVDRDGYGRGELSAVGGQRQRTVYVHRLAYETFVGPIPAGLTVDHLCHTRDQSCPGGSTCPHRRCANPEHLEPVTVAENLRRSPHTFAGRKLRRELEAMVLAGVRP